ncbi:MAG: hypothetical protein QM726_08380 [Chitinophagaceae bacterium]
MKQSVLALQVAITDNAGSLIVKNITANNTQQHHCLNRDSPD